MDDPQMREGAPHHGNASSERNGRLDQAKSLKASGVKSKAIDERQINAASDGLERK
jgi:hypothetical protein